MSGPHFYTFESTSSGCFIEFLQPSHTKWEPEILIDSAIGSLPLAGKSCHLRGKAPLWMYAHSALAVARAAASEIFVHQPHEAAGIRIFPLPEGSHSNPPWIRLEKSRLGGTILHVEPPTPGKRWSPADLPALHLLQPGLDPRLVALSGPCPNWLCSALALLAGHSATRKILYVAPVEVHAIRLNASPGEEVLCAKPPELWDVGRGRGVVLGVIGDPNSGKSVLAKILRAALWASGERLSWCLDCDYAAPTSDWYLAMVEQGRGEEAGRMRRNQKRQWTADAERELASEIENCKRGLRWTIADFPGGIPGDPPIRIPPGREMLLQAADAFVIVARKDRPSSVEGWEAALDKHGLRPRCIFTVLSGNHRAPLSLRCLDAKQGSAEMDGLDRACLDASSLGAAMPDAVRLIFALLARAPQPSLRLQVSSGRAHRPPFFRPVGR